MDVPVLTFIMIESIFTNGLAGKVLFLFVGEVLMHSCTLPIYGSLATCNITPQSRTILPFAPPPPLAPDRTLSVREYYSMVYRWSRLSQCFLRIAMPCLAVDMFGS